MTLYRYLQDVAPRFWEQAIPLVMSLRLGAGDAHIFEYWELMVTDFHRMAERQRRPKSFELPR